MAVEKTKNEFGLKISADEINGIVGTIVYWIKEILVLIVVALKDALSTMRKG